MAMIGIPKMREEDTWFLIIGVEGSDARGRIFYFGFENDDGSLINLDFLLLISDDKFEVSVIFEISEIHELGISGHSGHWVTPSMHPW